MEVHGGRAGDDAAIATNKPALLPGGTASFLNVTSYARGINGVMVDVSDLPAGVTLEAADFVFRSGTSADRSTWTAGPEPVQVATREVAPGRQRVSLIWNDYDPRSTSSKQQAVANGWLEVTLKANGRTNLAADDVFYVGNLTGETGAANDAGVLEVSSTDIARVRAGQLAFGAAVSNPYDFNRDGRVNVLDLNVARSRESSLLTLFSEAPVTAASGPTRDTFAPLPDRATTTLRSNYGTIL